MTDKKDYMTVEELKAQKYIQCCVRWCKNSQWMGNRKDGYGRGI